MRKFYFEYRENKKVQALTAQISLTSNLVDASTSEIGNGKAVDLAQ